MKQILFIGIVITALFAGNLGFIVGQTSHHSACVFGGSHASIADHFSHWQNAFCSVQTSTFLFLSVALLCLVSFVVVKSFLDTREKRHLSFVYIPPPYLEQLFSRGILHSKKY